MPLRECVNHHMFNGDKYGDICPHCGVKIAETMEEKTPEEIEENKRMKKLRRVCGWLVCIKGENEGEAYPIRSGKNFIGSGDDMDIQIVDDRYVDKYRHGVIVFDPKKTETMLLPGESKGLIYLEQNAIYATKKLDPFAQIEIGESVFLFVPFCGEHFSWDS